MFKKLGLRGKLLGLTLLSAAGLLAVGTVGVVSLRSVSRDYDHVAEVNLRKVEQLSLLRVFFRQTRIELRTLGIEGIPKPEFDRAVGDVGRAIADYHAAAQGYETVPFSEGEAPIYEHVKTEWDSFHQLGGRILALAASTSPVDHARMVSIFFKECPESAARYKARLDELVRFHQQRVDLGVAQARATAAAANFITLALLALGFVTVLVAGLLISRSVSSEITQSVSRLDHEASLIASAALQIAGTSDRLLGGVQTQASAIQETSSAVEEMSVMIARNAQGAEESAEKSSRSRERAGEGFESVQRMIAAIAEVDRSNERIVERVARSGQEMGELVALIREIAERTKVINDIVFQTKILAFNASVEAARAGEHGKGFAVVAEEVGNLAQMSGNAAKEISSMLQSSAERVEGTIGRTRAEVDAVISAGKAKVVSAGEVAGRCGAILRSLLDDVTTVNGRVGEISSASREQATGVGEINRAMATLNELTHQTHAGFSETAGAAGLLSDQAQSLRAIVLRLGAIVHGASGAPTPASIVAAYETAAPAEAAPTPVPVPTRARAV